MNSSEKRDELINNSLNQLRRLGKKWQDRLTMDNLRLDERYVVGQLNIWIHFKRTWRGATSEFLAVLQDRDARTLGIGLSLEGQTGGRWGRSERSDNAEGPPWCGTKADSPISQAEGGNNQQAVLVEIVKLVKSPEVLVPTLVRLRRFDELQRCRRNTVYYSWVKGLVFLGSLADRISGPICNRPPISLNQLTSQVVQRGTQVMHSVTDDRGEADGDLLPDLVSVDALSGLRIEIDANTIWISGAERLPLSIKIADVFFGPFDFRPDAD